MEASLPEGWEKVPSASRPGQFAYTNKTLNLRVASLEQVAQYTSQIAKPVSDKPAPPGFKLLASQLKPDTFQYYDTRTQKRYDTVEAAWEAYNANQQKVTAPAGDG